LDLVELKDRMENEDIDCKDWFFCTKKTRKKLIEDWLLNKSIDKDSTILQKLIQLIYLKLAQKKTSFFLERGVFWNDYLLLIIKSIFGIY